MRDVEKLRELLERCEAASGPDRDLDARIAAVLKTGDGLPDWARCWKGEWTPTIAGAVVLRHDDGTPGPNFTAGPFTASLDASIALVERMLPGWGNTVGRSPDGIAQASVFDPDRRKPPFSYLHDRADGSRPLALLTAALRALISQAEGEGA